MGRIKDEYDIPFGSSTKKFNEGVEDYKLKDQYKQVLETRKRTSTALGELENEIEINKARVLPVPDGTIIMTGNGGTRNMIDGSEPVGKENSIARDSGIVEGDECSYQLLEDGSIWAGNGGTNRAQATNVRNSGAELKSKDGYVFSFIRTSAVATDVCYYFPNNVYTAGKWYRVKWKVINGAEWFDKVSMHNSVFGGTNLDSTALTGELEKQCTTGADESSNFGIGVYFNGVSPKDAVIEIALMIEESDSEKGYSSPFCETSRPEFLAEYSTPLSSIDPMTYIARFDGIPNPQNLGTMGLMSIKDKWLNLAYANLPFNEGANRVVMSMKNGVTTSEYLNGVRITEATLGNISIPHDGVSLNAIHNYPTYTPNAPFKYSLLVGKELTEEEAKMYSMYDVDVPQNSELIGGRTIARRDDNGRLPDVKNMTLGMPKGTVLAVGNGSMEDVISGKLPIGRESAVAKDSGIVQGTDCSYQLLKDGGVWAGVGGTNDFQWMSNTADQTSIRIGNTLRLTQAGTRKYLVFSLNSTFPAGDGTFTCKINLPAGYEIIRASTGGASVSYETSDYNKSSGELIFNFGLNVKAGWYIHIELNKTPSVGTVFDIVNPMLVQGTVAIPFCETSSPDYKVDYDYGKFLLDEKGLFITKFYGKPTNNEGHMYILMGYGKSVKTKDAQAFIKKSSEGWNKLSVTPNRAYLNGVDITSILTIGATEGAITNLRFWKATDSDNYKFMGNVKVMCNILAKGDFTEEEARMYSIYDVDFPQNGEIYPVGRSLVKRNDDGQINDVTNPNLLINGCMSVDQRNNYLETDHPKTAYTADRWKVRANTGTTKVTVSKGYSLELGSYLTINHAGATSYGYIEQPIEIGGRNYTNFIGKKATFSYNKFNNDSIDEYLKLYWTKSGAISSDVVEGYIGNTKEGRSNITVTIPSIKNFVEGEEYFLNCLLYYGTNDGNTSTLPTNTIVRFSKIKLELGSVATPFVPDDPATNLAKCQRYYYKPDRALFLDGYGINGVYNTETLNFNFRKVPAVLNLRYTGSNLHPDGLSVNPSKSIVQILCRTASSVPVRFYATDINFELDAEI